MTTLGTLKTKYLAANIGNPANIILMIFYTYYKNVRIILY